LTWCNSPAALTLILLCGHCQYIRWGTYGRKPRPDGIEIRIQRFFCLVCSRTCSALPAFLLGHVHYTTITVAPYVAYIAEKSASIAEAWAQDPADGFPLDLATLYRWFKWLVFRWSFLLAMLEQERLNLTPETDLDALEKLLAKSAARRSRHLGPATTDTASVCASALSLSSLCHSSLGLTKQLLRTTGKLLGTPQDKTFTPVAFLNLFCCQKTGQALLSPLPQKTPLPPERPP
jgi:hypothetical protein